MTDYTGDVTVIGGRVITAYDGSTPAGDVELRCEQHGPRPRPLHSEGTTFRVIASFLASTSSAGADSMPVVLTYEAPSLWEAMVVARRGLEERGWLLPIAASRIDCYGIYASRHADSTVVVSLDDPETIFGLLSEAPLTDVGTVEEQETRYQQWFATSTTPAERIRP